MSQRILGEIVQDPLRRELRIFLCGATSTDKASVRERLAKAIRQAGRAIQVYYPEDLFDELLTGVGHHNLLQLENLLAEGVDAIVIVLEGCGAFTELGAFANHEKLRKKVIVIQDRRYQRDRSFIQLGPIQLVRAEAKGHIISVDFRDAENILKMLLSEIFSLQRQRPEFNLSNLFHTQDFLLPLLYVLHTLTRRELAAAIEVAGGVEVKQAEAMVSASLAMLRAERLIASTDIGTTLTAEGQRRARASGLRTATLDSLQVEELHRTCRRSRRRSERKEIRVSPPVRSSERGP